MIKLEHTGTGEIFYATRFSAGFDICANQHATIAPHTWQLIKTGLRITETSGTGTLHFSTYELPCVPEIQIRPRSGLALKHGVTILNSPCTIDADYRGEIMVNLINHSDQDFIIQAGDRIAQGICALSIQLPHLKVKDIERGQGGFGSSGKN